MSYISKTLFIFFFCFYFLDSSFAHGPSRQKVSESIQINSTPENVWKVVRNFKNFTWNKNIKNIKADNADIGSERVINFKTGESIKQKLEKIDEKKMMISWRIIETDNKVLPVNSYSAKIFVKSSGDHTIVNYKSGFYRGFMGNDPPDELNDENSKIKVKNFILDNLNGLKEIIEKN